MAGTVNWGTATVIGMFAGMLYGGSKEASASVVRILFKKENSLFNPYQSFNCCLTLTFFYTNWYWVKYEVINWLSSKVVVTDE